MNFISLDFETANSKRSSPCEIGITIVEDGKIKHVESSLIKPHTSHSFDYFNILIHGINEDSVEDAPEFNTVWETFKNYLEGNLVIAHNASFDLSVLRHTLDLYGLPYPNIKFICTYQLAKQVWKGLPSYSLGKLCEFKDIKNDFSHRAEFDSMACAQLAIKAFKELNINSEIEFETIFKTPLGILSDNLYKPLSFNANKPRQKNIPLGDPTKHNQDSIFYGKKVLFTGTLSSMERFTAQKIIADIGGINSDSISKNTDFLIIGYQDAYKVGYGSKSSKEIKAAQLIENGATIEILSEKDFIDNI